GNGITAHPCYYECGIDHDWVCGTDDKSYQNPCMLNISACNAQDKIITIKHHGPCEVVKECPEKHFMFEGVKKPFIIFKDKGRTWDEAMKKCEDEMLEAVHLSNEVAVTLRKFILHSCGDIPIWLNARANGSMFIWQDNQTELRKMNPVWLIGDPTSIFDMFWHYLDKRVTTEHCLALAVWHEDWSKRPRRAYASKSCLYHYTTICTGCPRGFFQIESSRKCFHIINDVERNWFEARAKCKEQNAVLATPSEENAVALRKHISDTYVVAGEVWKGRWYLWLDAMVPAGKGRVMWQRNSTELSRDHHLWLLEEPDIRKNRDMCLVMAFQQSVISNFPKQVYATYPCTDRKYTLCE
ncbi:unnamed protein product, partial [Meganyctiphanes norvegica]